MRIEKTWRRIQKKEARKDCEKEEEEEENTEDAQDVHEKMPQVHCMDARDFVRSVVQKQEREAGEKADPSAMMSMFNHAVINLPASGLEFIDVFRHLFEERLWRGREKDLPHVHCYTFIGKQEDEETVRSSQGLALKT